MKKYDRESNTRVWEGLPKLVIRWLMVAFSAYCIIDTVFLSTRQEVRLPMFVGLILLFGFLTFPAKKGDERVNHMPWYDIVLLIAGPGAYFFYAVNAQNVVQMSARVMQNDLYMIIGLIGILALVELCRRCVGLPILCVAGVLLVYTFFNLGGSADFKMTLYQVIRTMFYTFNGIFGGPISVCAKFIVVFIIFGAFLERTGIAQFFINLVDNEFLDHTAPSTDGWGYCVFGKVTEGLDVVDKIAKVKTKTLGFHENVPADMVVITGANRF